MTNIHLDRFSYSEQELNDGVFPLLTFSGRNQESIPEIFDVPLQAVANRMEIYGLSTYEESLEFIFRVTQNPSMPTAPSERVISAYSSVVNAEYAAASAIKGSYNPSPDIQGKTFMSLDVVSTDRRQELEEARTDVLQLIGMKDSGATAMASRTSGSALVLPPGQGKDVELSIQLSLIEEAVSKIDSMADVVNIYKISTVADFVPQLARKLKEKRG